ncbi:MAG: sigma factor-like helix-turn-helix DNA-binding protein [Anaerovoracaceae bacterium]
MTREDLESIRSLRNELVSLQQEYINPKRTEVNIFYKDYKNGHPVPKVDSGIDCGEAEQKRLAKLIAQKTKVLQSRILKTEQWIDSIDDPEMRGIIRMYYEQGLTQEEIGNLLNIDRSVISRRLKSFFW